MRNLSESYEVVASAVDTAARPYRRDRYHDAEILELGDSAHPTITVHVGMDSPFLVTATEASGEFIYKRSLVNIRRDRADYYILFAILSGTVRLLYNGRRSVIEAGAFVFARTNVPYEMIVCPGAEDQYCQICISLPAGLAEELRLAEIAGIAIRPSGSNTCLMQELSRTLYRQGATLPPAVANSLLTAIMLGVSQMAEDALGPEKQKVSTRDTRRKAIMTYLDSHCTNPDLRAEMVASACQMSVRYMSNLLSELDSSFSKLVRIRRLKRMASWLADPALDNETVSSLAYRSGFNSASLCISLFRQEYGCTPRIFRLKRMSGCE